MSQENVEIVREVYEASARRDRDAVLSLYDPDVEWDVSQHPMGKVFEQGTRRGHEGLVGWFRDWYEVFEDFEHSLDELIDLGELVVSVGTDRGRGRSSGVEVARTICGVWTVRDGKVVRVVWFPSREDALAAAKRGRAGALSTADLAREFMEALNKRDATALAEISDPGVEWHSLFAEVGEGGIYIGHEGARRWMADLDEAWESVRGEVTDTIAAGRVAVLVGRIHYRGKGSGVETEVPVGWVVEFERGKVARFRAFRDPERALATIGEPEASDSAGTP
jgi:ketosteroid isomerase-like protein